MGRRLAPLPTLSRAANLRRKFAVNEVASDVANYD